MRLTRNEKRLLENEMLRIIRKSPKSGTNTRVLIGLAVSNLKRRIPHLNRHHAAGMLSFVMRSSTHKWLVRTPGYSIVI